MNASSALTKASLNFCVLVIFKVASWTHFDFNKVLTISFHAHDIFLWQESLLLRVILCDDVESLGMV